MKTFVQIAASTPKNELIEKNRHHWDVVRFSKDNKTVPVDDSNDDCFVELPISPPIELPLPPPEPIQHQDPPQKPNKEAMKHVPAASS